MFMPDYEVIAILICLQPQAMVCAIRACQTVYILSCLLYFLHSQTVSGAGNIHYYVLSIKRTEVLTVIVW
jgi:hypothetical protein